MTKKYEPIRLTDLQLSFLSHRLGVPCAIAEVLIDNEPPRYNESQFDEIMDACGSLLEKLEETQTIDVEKLTSLDKDIIDDCFTGNTWFANAETELEPPKFNAQVRSLDSLAEKLKRSGVWVDPFPTA